MLGSLISAPGANALLSENRVWDFFPSSPLTAQEKSLPAPEGNKEIHSSVYDLASGRHGFHTLDTYEGRNGEPLTLHKYLYTHGNPVNGTDPSGNFLLTELALVLNIQTNQRQTDAQRSEGQRRAITRTPITLVRFGVGSGLGSPGVFGNILGHAFVYAESLRSRGQGLLFDANPDFSNRNNARRFARNRNARVTGFLGVSPISRRQLSRPPLKGKLITPGIPLGPVQTVVWITLTKALDANLTYQFYAIPGGETVNCYTWAAQAYAKAIFVRATIR